LVKEVPGANVDPSGIETSLMKRAWSHTAVAGIADVEVGSVNVGKEGPAVFVGATGGRVGVLNVSDGVNCACTVSAAAVKTAFGSSVAGALDGRLQAESRSMITVSIEVLRMNLYILFSSLKIIYKNTDGH
jgi:hypothetical protein